MSDDSTREAAPLTFADWMGAVDRYIGRKCGLSHADLSDFLWRDAFDGGASPSEAAQEALEAECEDMGFDPEEMDW